MKIIFISFIYLILGSQVLASDCSLKTDESYFLNLEGEPIGDPGTSSYKIVYTKAYKFTPDTPVEASLNIPFTGDCKDLLIFKVQVFRAIGRGVLNKSEKEADHDHGHAHIEIKDQDLKWDKGPIFDGKKQEERKEALISLSPFYILKMMKKVPHDKHVWKFKFIVKYQVSGGETKSFEKIMKSPLIH